MPTSIKLILIILSVALTSALVYFFAAAGTFSPTLAPADTLVTLEDIYAKITNATATAFALDSPASPAGTMHTLEEIYNRAAEGYDGRGWVASTTGADAITALNIAACQAAAPIWQWFEDGNGDGDTSDPEDGICVRASTTMALSWNGYDYTTNYDNTYIAGYTCEGNFPNGTVKAGTYNGLTSAGAADTTWNDGDCALCQADCYDGRRDLPAQGSYTSNNGNITTGYNGWLMPEVLKKWKGTRLPTFEDFYGYCGYKNGGSDYETGCSSDKKHGNYGQMSGRTDECLDLSNSGSYEWLSEQVYNSYARVAGYYACSYSSYDDVYDGDRFRAVFRP